MPTCCRQCSFIRRLEGRLSAKEARLPSELAPGELAVHLLNGKLTDATDEVLDQLTLEQLLEQVTRASGQQQQMYYI